MSDPGKPRWIVDTSGWPLVLFRLPGKPKELPDFEAAIRDLEALLARKERFVLIQDLTYASPDATRRKRLVAWIKQNELPLKQCIVSMGIVAPTAFHRGLIQATMWFVDPVIPIEVFPSTETAVTWAQRIGREAGLLVKPR